MTLRQKNELIAELITLLEEKIEIDTEEKSPPQVYQSEKKTIEMLTVKECTETVNGLSEHTVRQLIKQSKLPFIRTGAGKNGKILINKTALLNYFENPEVKIA